MSVQCDICLEWFEWEEMPKHRMECNPFYKGGKMEKKKRYVTIEKVENGFLYRVTPLESYDNTSVWISDNTPEEIGKTVLKIFGTPAKNA